jgi:hypothetical protein
MSYNTDDKVDCQSILQVPSAMEFADTEGSPKAVPSLLSPEGRQQKATITRLGRRYAAYLLILIVVLIAAVLGGVCGSGRCSSSEGSSETPDAAGEIRRKPR